MIEELQERVGKTSRIERKSGSRERKIEDEKEGFIEAISKQTGHELENLLRRLDKGEITADEVKKMIKENIEAAINTLKSGKWTKEK